MRQPAQREANGAWNWTPNQNYLAHLGIPRPGMHSTTALFIGKARSREDAIAKAAAMKPPGYFKALVWVHPDYQDREWGCAVYGLLVDPATLQWMPGRGVDTAILAQPATANRFDPVPMVSSPAAYGAGGKGAMKAGGGPGQAVPATGKESRPSNGKWMRDQAALLLQKADEVEADEKWAEDTLGTLNSMAKIETLESETVQVIAEERWAGFATMVVQKNCRDAEHAKLEMQEFLDSVPFIEAGAQKLFDISLNYEAGGSQYRSCVKFAVKKSEDGKKIIFASSLFGKKWVRAKEYDLNRNFWESSPTPQRLKNYLEGGANKRLAKALQGPDGQQALEML